MYNPIDVKEKIIIINSSSLSDVSILKENYKFLIYVENDDKEKENLILLSQAVENRLKELSE